MGVPVGAGLGVASGVGGCAMASVTGSANKTKMRKHSVNAALMEQSSLPAHEGYERRVIPDFVEGLVGEGGVAVVGGKFYGLGQGVDGRVGIA